MKKRKFFFLLIVGLFIMTGIYGCGITAKNRPERMKDLALAYLEENYDDSFKPLGYFDGGWAYPYETVTFTSEKYGKAVEVIIYDNDGKYTFEDDYFQLYMQSDAISYFRALIKKLGYTSEIKVRFESLKLPDSLERNASFAEYVASGKCDVEVYIITASEISERDRERFLAKLCENKIMGHFRFVVTSDEYLLASYDISGIVNEKEDTIMEKKSYSINSSYQVTE
jgi:hypothetical protein